MVRCVKSLSILLFMILMMSCSKKQDDIIISTKFQGETWGRFDYLTAFYEVRKAPMTADVILEVVVNDDYPSKYPNHQDDGSFKINMTIKTPEGGSRSRDYSFNLKDKDGNWKSEKINGCYTFNLPLISKMTFGEKGDYQFKIENKYPKDPLCGIISLKIKASDNND